MEREYSRLYQEIIRNFSRLSPKVTLPVFTETYLFNNVSPSVTIAHMMGVGDKKLADEFLAEYSQVKLKMVKVLGDLISSSDWNEFESFYVPE